MAAITPSAIPGQPSSSGTYGKHAIVQMGGKSPMEERRERNQGEKVERNQVDEKFLTTLAAKIGTAWERNKRAKLEVEQRMLRNLRQRQRHYEADIYAAIKEQGGSEHYDGLTATKCRAAESWIMDVLVPSGDRPWDIEPTPIPDISPDVKSKIEQRVMSAAVQEALMAEQTMGVQMDGNALAQLSEMVSERLEEAYQEAVEEEAEETAENMARLIEDQFKEGKFYPEFQALISDFVTFPAAFLMGPIFRRRKLSEYAMVNGKWMPQVGQKIVREFCRVSPFDVYPEADATGIQDGDLFVRMRLSRKELSSFRNVKGYDTEAIDAVIDEYGQGGLRDWTVIDQERGRAESRHSSHLYESTKIEALRFWGSVQGAWLQEHITERGTGLNPDMIDPYEDYEIDAIKIGDYIIRAVVNPDKLGRKPIAKACYEEVPGAFWGNGVPDLIEHDQQAVNALSRHILNNSAMSSGPIVERNIDRTAGDDGRLYPWKEYLSTEEQMREGSPAVHFHDIPSNARELKETLREYLNRADENSGVPAYAHGAEDVGGAGDTASGLTMLMSASSKLLRMAIYNLDTGVVEPTVERCYHYNMLFEEDESIKGDLRIVPKGATVLLIREQMAARQGEFADSTNNPVDFQLMGPEGRKKLRRAQAKNLNLSPDDLFPENVTQPMAQPGGQAGPGATPGGVMDRGNPATMDMAGRPLADYQRQ